MWQRLVPPASLWWSEDALAMFRAGEPLDVVADEYGMPREQLEDAVRTAVRATV